MEHGRVSLGVVAAAVVLEQPKMVIVREVLLEQPVA